jgi:hypothetical protein
LACGLVGFIMHNTVSFSFWMPGAAIAFWLGSGAVISLRREGVLDLSHLRWGAVGGAITATLAVIVLLWWPVARRSWATEMVVDSLIDRDGQAALNWAQRAAQYDRLDPIAAADVARLLQNSGRKADQEQAYRWSTEAIRRCPVNSSNHRLAADILWSSEGGSAAWVRHMDDAVRRDPQSLSMRIGFAERLVEAGMGSRGIEQLRAAEEIHNALAPDSIFRFNAEALNGLRALKARAVELDEQ